MSNRPLKPRSDHPLRWSGSGPTKPRPKATGAERTACCTVCPPTPTNEPAGKRRRRKGWSLRGRDLPPEHIANAAHRLDQLGIGRIFLQLLAQPADMHIDGACVARVFVAPHFMQQLITC